MNGKILGNYLCDRIVKEYKARPDTFGRPIMKFYENLNDRMRDEENGLISFGVERCYGDYFIIIRGSINSSDLPFLDILLKSPYNGKLYVSNYDKRMQVRISGYTIENMYKEELGVAE